MKKQLEMWKNASNLILHKSKSQSWASNRKVWVCFPMGKEKKRKFFWLQSDMQYSCLAQWFMVYNLRPVAGQELKNDLE